MRVLLIGADGFVGSSVAKILRSTDQVLESIYGGGLHPIDLLDKRSIIRVLRTSKPDAIVHCAGVVDKGENAKLNVTFTRNLLEAITFTGVIPKKILICGSASVYGIVGNTSPVSEEDALEPVGLYAQAKTEESIFAHEYALKHGLSLVEARLFNPIGVGMASNMLIPTLLTQIDELCKGGRNTVEITRLDSQRDYIDITDVSNAIAALLHTQLKHTVYNIGSGNTTSNRDLIEGLLALNKLDDSGNVIETNSQPEPIFACRANINRIKSDTGWYPKKTIQESLKEIVRG